MHLKHSQIALPNYALSCVPPELNRGKTKSKQVGMMYRVGEACA